MRIFIILFLLFLIFAIVQFFRSMYKYVNEVVLPYRRIKRNRLEIEGEVIDIRISYNNMNRWIIRNPIVNFEYNGVGRKAISIFSISLFADDIEEGKKVTVVFNRENPSEAFVKNTISSDLIEVEIFVVILFYFAIFIGILVGLYFLFFT